jgi:hypothetical protein
MSIEAMKQKIEDATKAMEAACIKIDELKAENEFLRQAIAEAEKQEPVAWQERHAKRMNDGVVTEWTNWYPCQHRTIDDARAEASDHIPYEWRPVYTHPQPKGEHVIDKSAAIRIATALGWEPKREWVGLTDKDIEEAYKQAEKKEPYMGAVTRKGIAEAFEQILKEKNT